MIILCSILLIGCGKDKTSTVNFVAKYYFGDSLLKRNADYPFVESGKKYFFRPDVIKIYLSKITTTSLQTNTLISDLCLFNLQQGNVVSIIENMPVGTYDGLTVSIGLTAAQNNADPNSFASSHPLSTSQGMYWGMMKYRFMVIEGKLLDSSGVILNSISYHTGVDLANIILYPKSFEVIAGKTTNLQYKIDLKNLFKGINPTTESSTHASPGAEYDLAERVTSNIINGASLSITY